MPRPTDNTNNTSAAMEDMEQNARHASAFLKTISHEGRLMILCHLSSGEKSVSELEALLNYRQAAASQQLSRLRRDGLVSTRRVGKTIYYSLSDPRAVRFLDLLYDVFCNTDGAAQADETAAR